MVYKIQKVSMPCPPYCNRNLLERVIFKDVSYYAELDRSRERLEEYDLETVLKSCKELIGQDAVVASIWRCFIFESGNLCVPSPALREVPSEWHTTARRSPATHIRKSKTLMQCDIRDIWFPESRA
jgi:hypothetical protein